MVIAEPAELARVLIDAVPGGVLQAVRDGGIAVANAEAIAFLALRFDPATERWLAPAEAHVVHHDGRRATAAELPIARVLATGAAEPPVTLGYVRSGVPVRWAVVRATPTHDRDGALGGVIVTFLDVTEQKIAEDERRRNDAIWRSLASSVPDFITLLDRHRRILSVNHTLPDLPVDHVLGRTNHEFIHESYRDEWERHWQTVLSTRTKVRFETCGVGPDRRECWYETILVPVEVPGTPEVEQVMVVSRDITSRREMLKSLAEKERLASVGMISASVAHEIMNPLTYVLANLEFALSERCPPGARMTKALLDAREGALRMQQIARDLRSLGRAGSEELFYVDVRSVVDTALRLAGPEVARTASLELVDIPGVLASESRLCQVFLNLFVNAAQAMAERPAEERRIRVTSRTLEDEGFLGIDVADTGPGIPATELGRVFEPFYTTKRTGTGLGLSISRDSLAQMGGRLEVASEPGRGTTFTVWLSTRRQPAPRVTRGAAALP